MATQWPLVVQGLIAMLPTLPGWSNVIVYDGPVYGADASTEWVTVGYVADDTAGTYTVTQSPDGFRWEEAGEVRMQLVSNVGDNALSVPRARAFALADALDASIRTDRTLGGLLSLDSMVELVVDVHIAENAKGSGQSLVLTVRYTTCT